MSARFSLLLDSDDDDTSLPVPHNRMISQSKQDKARRDVLQCTINRISLRNRTPRRLQMDHTFHPIEFTDLRDCL